MWSTKIQIPYQKKLRLSKTVLLAKEVYDFLVKNNYSFEKKISSLEFFDKIIDKNEHPEDIYGVIIEMCFQLGYPRLCGFKKFKAALENKDYVTASAEMLDSRWAKQTPNRANGLADIVRNV